MKYLLITTIFFQLLPLLPIKAEENSFNKQVNLSFYEFNYCKSSPCLKFISNSKTLKNKTYIITNFKKYKSKLTKGLFIDVKGVLSKCGTKICIRILSLSQSKLN